ncbi:hypothetical protein [Caldisalinibacter kiritimatiensis]|uniref:Uncharacterized protein n=1 Tax=Caldisalinibacter kiritimatiensis TaxID=1304284 RepID=R1CNE7_9FIRM|nr:hypothetical protein [Caldisalinibacter kiritimatiensis]EOD00236.1 hypothetical protein L21TH_1710 [Caldisalinibacter kiritimatiensis]
MVAPRRKRYNRKQRLPVAKKWIPTYKGKNLVKGYSKWFGVDKVCAITELELLGHEIDSKYKEQIFKQHKFKSEDGQKKNNEEREELEFWPDSDFYFITAYTSGGTPYGITWEEYERDIKEETEDREDEKKNIKKIGLYNDYEFFDEDIPF